MRCAGNVRRSRERELLVAHGDQVSAIVLPYGETQARLSEYAQIEAANSPFGAKFHRAAVCIGIGRRSAGQDKDLRASLAPSSNENQQREQAAARPATPRE